MTLYAAQVTALIGLSFDVVLAGCMIAALRADAHRWARANGFTR